MSTWVSTGPDAFEHIGTTIEAVSSAGETWTPNELERARCGALKDVHALLGPGDACRGTGYGPRLLAEFPAQRPPRHDLVASMAAV